MNDTIRCHTYANGLVLVAEEIKSLESAAFTFLVPAGCAFDPLDRLGLGSITCEMAMRGAGNRGSREIVQDLENLGVQRSESVSVSHTGFSGAMLASNLEAALEIFADVLRRPHLPDDQLEPARLVVIQELRSVEDEPPQKVMLELRRRQYPDPWGRASHGDAPGLEAVTLADVRGYHGRYYQPRGAILGVAGNIEWDALRDHVGEWFGDWKPVETASPATGPPLARREHLHQESNQTQIGIAYDSVPYRDANYFQAWGAVGCLSGGMSSRLFTEVREKRGLCYSVYATYHTLRDRGSVLCYAGTTAERAQETLDVTLREILRLPQGVEPDELDRLKAHIKSALIMQQESSSARSSAIARDWYHLSRVYTLGELGAVVDALSCETINAYLAKHPPEDFTIVTLGPKALEVPVGVS